jgi:hypothetical protein
MTVLAREALLHGLERMACACRGVPLCHGGSAPCHGVGTAQGPRRDKDLRRRHPRCATPRAWHSGTPPARARHPLQGGAHARGRRLAAGHPRARRGWRFVRRTPGAGAVFQNCERALAARYIRRDDGGGGRDQGASRGPAGGTGCSIDAAMPPLPEQDTIVAKRCPASACFRPGGCVLRDGRYPVPPPSPRARQAVSP